MKTAPLLKKVNSALASLEKIKQLLEQAEAQETSGSASKVSAVKKAAVKPVTGVPAKKRAMSSEGRERIAAAQRKRWAAQKKSK